MIFLHVVINSAVQIYHFHNFTALQCWNNVETIRNNVVTMLQRCVALEIVVANRLV